MPFRISSAPEVFQLRMHDLIEGLSGVAVVAGDFVAIGFETHLKKQCKIMTETWQGYCKGVSSDRSD